jgi:molybdate transport system substrate-binding protein
MAMCHLSRRVVAAGLLFSAAAWAQNTPLHAIASNGMRAVIEELQPKLEKAAGRPLAFEYGTTTDLVRKIGGGQPFDLVILTSDAITNLSKSGKVTGQLDFARCGVGVGIKSGAKKPAIGTSAQMKATLLAAKSVTWAKEGASRPFVERMLKSMGIADQMTPKTVLAPGSGAATTSVAEGRVDLVLTLISEIVGVPGVDLIGGLPKEHQDYISFSGGASPNTNAAANVKAALAVLKSSDAAPVYKAKGMEPR